jgi:hypothetical protein
MFTEISWDPCCNCQVLSVNGTGEVPRGEPRQGLKCPTTPAWCEVAGECAGPAGPVAELQKVSLSNAGA